MVRSPTDDRAVGPARWIAWLGAIAAATVALPTLNCLQRGQVSVPILYLLLLGLRLILGGRTYRAAIVGGIVLALPVAIKIVPILPVAFLLFVQLVGFLRSRWQQPALAAQLGRQLAGSTLGVGLGLALFFFLLPAALIGWNANLRHLDTWNHLVLSSAGDSSATPGFENDTHSVRNQCLGNALYRLGNFGAYMFAGGPEDPLVDDDNPPPRLMDAPSVNRCLLAVRIALLLGLMLVGLRLALAIFDQRWGRHSCLPKNRRRTGQAGMSCPAWPPQPGGRVRLGVRGAVGRLAGGAEPLFRAAGAGRVVRAAVARPHGPPPRGRRFGHRAVRAGAAAICSDALRRPNRPAGSGQHRLGDGGDGVDGQGRRSAPAVPAVQNAPDHTPPPP